MTGAARGKIIKGVGGFYYVHVAGRGVYECRARGIFRLQNVKPLVGDDVEISIISEQEMTGNVEAVLPRRSELYRPAVANIDFALVIFAAADPKPNFALLDRMLVSFSHQGVPAAICINKADLADGEEESGIRGAYAACGCPVFFTSARLGEGIGDLRSLIRGRTAAVAGPSGAGKSSLVNCLQSERQMETGEVSRKIGRGKNTTRHSEIVPIEEEGAYIVDTPGFSSLDLPGLSRDNLRDYYPEFAEFAPQCRFRGCAHYGEPDCGVKRAARDGRISARRYESYRLLYEELGAQGAR